MIYKTLKGKWIFYLQDILSRAILYLLSCTYHVFGNTNHQPKEAVKVPKAIDDTGLGLFSL